MKINSKLWKVPKILSIKFNNTIVNMLLKQEHISM